MDHYQVNVNLANEKMANKKVLDEQVTIDNIKPGLHQTNVDQRSTLN